MNREFWTRSIIITVSICFLALVGVSGFIIGRNTSPPKYSPPKQTQQLLPAKAKTVLFFIKTTPANFYLKPMLYQLPDGGDIHTQALEGLFMGPPPNSKLNGVFPKDTKVLGLVVKNGVAYVNLNRRATQLNVGSAGEALAVASIVNTLTKFPDVFRVKILIEGKEVESLAGHVDLTGLLHYNDQIIDPELF